MILRIPRDKHDLEAVEALAQQPVHELESLLPELLEWLQDYNWPVARALVPVLSRCGLEIVPPLKAVLQSDDDVWKYWLLEALVIHLKTEVREALRDDVLRIINQPTQGERDEEVVDAARDLLGML